jgi:hypothetical protein
MPAANDRTFWQSAAAIAAAALVLAAAFAASSDSLAQNLPKDQRAQKKAPPPPKGPMQMRKGPMGNAPAGPNRFGSRGPLGAGGAQGGHDPRFNTFNRGPNARFGNQPGNRAFGNQQGRFNQARGFTNRDPRL